MKPLNSINSSCSPVSSNCIIWNGPDLDCIDIQSGDSISEVTYNIAKELCEVIDSLNITSYDLSCFKIGNCQPSDYKELIQFILDKLCELNDIQKIDSNTSSEDVQTILDTEVEVAKCFYTENKATGDTITSMSLKEYVKAIGSRICNVRADVAKNTSDISVLRSEMDELLDGKTDDNEMPEAISYYIKENSSLPLDVFCQYLEKDLYPLRTVLGEENEIANVSINAVSKYSLMPQLQEDSKKMNELNGWVNSVSTLAESYNNMGLLIEDMRNTISYLYNILKTNNLLKASISISNKSNVSSNENSGKWLNVLFTFIDGGNDISDAVLYISNDKLFNVKETKNIKNAIINASSSTIQIQYAKSELSTVEFDDKIYLKIVVTMKDSSTVECDTYEMNLNSGVTLTQEDLTQQTIKLTSVDPNRALYTYRLFLHGESTEEELKDVSFNDEGYIKITDLSSDTTYVIKQYYNNELVSKSYEFTTKAYESVEHSVQSSIVFSDSYTDGDFVVDEDELEGDYINDFITD